VLISIYETHGRGPRRFLRLPGTGPCDGEFWKAISAAGVRPRPYRHSPSISAAPALRYPHRTMTRRTPRGRRRRTRRASGLAHRNLLGALDGSAAWHSSSRHSIIRRPSTPDPRVDWPASFTERAGIPPGESRSASSRRATTSASTRLDRLQQGVARPIRPGRGMHQGVALLPACRRSRPIRSVHVTTGDDTSSTFRKDIRRAYPGSLSAATIHGNSDTTPTSRRLEFLASPLPVLNSL